QHGKSHVIDCCINNAMMDTWGVTPHATDWTGRGFGGPQTTRASLLGRGPIASRGGATSGVRAEFRHAVARCAASGRRRGVTRTVLARATCEARSATTQAPGAAAAARCAGSWVHD